MKKIKVLFIGMSNNIGGIEKYLINIYRNNDKNLFDMKFLVFSNEKPCFYEEIKDDVIYITHRKQNYFKFLKELKQIYIENDFDIIHVNIVDFSCFERITYAKKYSKAKIIIHSHIAKFKMPSLKTKILDAIGKKIVIKADNGFVKTACSGLAGDYMFEKFKDKNYTVLNNGIDVDEFKFNEETRKVIRKELGISDDEILLGNVGRMVYQKNQKYLINLLKKLSAKSNKYKLLIIGKGPLREEIINLAKEYNVFDKLIILQDINNVYDYMSAIDMFVLPSMFEGLAIVLVEAQASGLKCFTTKDLVTDESNITGNVKFIELESEDKWVSEIENTDYKNRNIDLTKIREGYDIKNTVLNVMDFYKKIVREDNE